MQILKGTKEWSQRDPEDFGYWSQWQEAVLQDLIDRADAYPTSSNVYLSRDAIADLNRDNRRNLAVHEWRMDMNNIQRDKQLERSAKRRQKWLKPWYSWFY